VKISEKGIEGIQITRDGTYRINSKMTFESTHESCQYWLEYGSQWQQCECSGVDLGGRLRRRPCGLKFSAKLKQGDVVKIHMFTGENCTVEEDSFKENMNWASLSLGWANNWSN